MKKRILSLFLLLPLFIFSFVFPTQISAATFRNGESVTVDESLTDLYATGGTVTIDAPVNNDLTVAGGTVNINDQITGGLLAAGGTLNIDGAVGNTLRAAGGTIRISRPVERDVVVAGGTITLDETASISGDLVVTGGTINIQSPVSGDVIVNGGQVTLNAPVKGNVQGDVGTLILGRQAVVNGDLTYTSGQRATLRDGAVINGKENYTYQERDHDGGKAATDKVAGLFTGWALYKLIADILTCLAFIYLLYSFTRRVILTGTAEPLKNGFIGLVSLFLGPILGVFLLVLLLPGVFMFLFYGMLLILAAFLSKLLVGWLLLRWWYGRDNREYILDWKAAIVGPIVMFVLLLIPILGWFVGFLIYLIALGGLVVVAFSWISSPGKTTPAKAAARSTAKRGR